jgi:hypothetical protein
MKRKGFIVVLAALLVGAVSNPSSGIKQAAADNAAPINPALVQAMVTAIPAPADDPLLDANGQPAVDAFGQPVSDPSEGFHKVIPQNFDPAHTFLVQSAWLDGIGCPTNAKTSADGTTTSPLPANGACQTGDTNDTHNEGLLLVKTGPTGNFAAATAELKKVRGSVLNEVGYDIRKAGGQFSPNGSHCGAGAPRFDIITMDNVDHFVGDCNMPPTLGPVATAISSDWIRLRWGTAQFAVAGPPIAPNSVVKRIVILFDEGSDTGTDNFGAAILDNIEFNGTLVGRGPAPGMKDDESGDDDNDD